MKLSFIKPRKKGILKRDTRYWLYFITVSSTAMFGLYGAMEYEIAKIKADTKKATEDRKFFSAEAVRLKNNYDVLVVELSKATDIKNSNTILKEDINNIFSIVPDQIKLTKMEIADGYLVLYGFTPSKEIYNLHLNPALKSIFTTSETSFIPVGGGLKFMSTNKLAEPQKSTESSVVENEEHQDKNNTSAPAAKTPSKGEHAKH